MTNKDIAKRVVLASGGIAKMADLLNSGLAKYEVNSLIKVGYLERVHHGFYKITEASNISEARLLASLLPEGIVCVESALFIMAIVTSLPDDGQLLYLAQSLGPNCESKLFR